MKNNLKERLTDTFHSACVARKNRRIGLELEHFIVSSKDDRSLSYYGDLGIGALLNSLKDRFPHSHYENGRLLGLSNEDYSITLEPAAQLEISIAPHSDLMHILGIYRQFEELLIPQLKLRNAHMENLGYQSASRVEDLPLIPKKRYDYMDRYFKKSGTAGANMMRGTASTQVSIDFTDEADFIRKYRFAYLLMPALKLICDNSPVFEGMPNFRPLLRTRIWRNTDRSRCEAPPALFADHFGFEAYADYLMNVPLILLPEGETVHYVGKQTAAQIFAEREFTEQDIAHIQSMVFPDVRLKSYIEIRGADSLPIEYALGYAALIKSLFYTEGIADYYLSRFRVTIPDILSAENALMEKGALGEIYGMPATDFIEYLFLDALPGLSESDQTFLYTIKSFWNNNNYR